MTFVSLKAWRSRSAERAALAGRLKGEISAALALGENDALHLNELACPDPGCPDLETVVLVMRAAEPTRAFRIRQTMDRVEPEDVARLVEEERAQRATA
jgi:hypothetical protein